jgi:Crinkler effector protein N-terminal domain
MLDTQVPSKLRLNCLIKGESIIFPVTVERDWVVGKLKKKIKKQQELGTLKGIDPHTLELWKVSIIDESRCEVTWAYSRTLTGQH